jgi:PIN domain nuclease of toxin-antitoxin system
MIVLDTHAWLWWVSDPSRLSRAAHRRIRTATQIGISAISCLEVATAVTKGRITLDREVLDWLEQALSLPKVELLPLTPLIAVKATQLGNDFPGDPADRVIAATSIVESAALVTKDSRVHTSGAVTVIW